MFVLFVDMQHVATLLGRAAAVAVAQCSPFVKSFSSLARRPAIICAAVESTSWSPSYKQPLLRTATPALVSTAFYKARLVLKRRCPQCRFVQRGDQLFVECKAKPRHKQMQIISRRKRFSED